MANVTINNLVKCYGSNVVVQGIDLEIPDGEFIVLVGPSGCGKSTTLRMIAGLEDITEGIIKIGNKMVNDMPPHKRNIAMVFQNYALYPHKTVEENIIFGLKKAGASKELIAERLASVSGMLQLEPLLDRKPSELSGGQRQRVAMGRALVRDADVFLFDEPLSNLDAKLRHHMRTEIAKIHQQVGTTTVYVTHDQVEAMTLGDRVVVMQDGVIEQVGTPMEIYLSPVNLFVATFIGSPSMNLIPATFDKATNQIQMADLFLDLAMQKNVQPSQLKDQQELLVGIRPDFFEDKQYRVQHKNVEETFWNVDQRKVELIELLGFDREISFKVGETQLKARLDLRSEVAAGEVLDLVVDPSRILIFDKKTGLKISNE